MGSSFLVNFIFSRFHKYDAIYLIMNKAKLANKLRTYTVTSYFGHIHFLLSSFSVSFIFCCLNFWSSSILVVFNFGRLQFWSSSFFCRLHFWSSSFGLSSILGEVLVELNDKA